MASSKASAALGGIALLGTAGLLAAFAAKQAREGELQEEIVARLVHLPGVDSAYIEVTRAYAPWQRTRVTGGVCLIADGIDEIEELFDRCVHEIRDVMDSHADFTAEIDLRAEPVDGDPGVHAEEARSGFTPIDAVSNH